MLMVEMLMTYDMPNIDPINPVKQIKASPKDWPQTAQSIKQSIKGALYHFIESIDIYRPIDCILTYSELVGPEQPNMTMWDIKKKEISKSCSEFEFQLLWHALIGIRNPTSRCPSHTIALLTMEFNILRLTSGMYGMGISCNREVTATSPQNPH